MNSPAPICVLLADTRRERFPLLAYQWAALRGLRCRRIDLAASAFGPVGLGPRVLLAASCPTLLSLDDVQACALRAVVHGGATLYVRGGFAPGRPCSLAPFARGSFVAAGAEHASGYRFPDHALLPKVLRNESANTAIDLPAARVIEGALEPLVYGLRTGAPAFPFILALTHGRGAVIYDLLPDQTPAGAMTPIVRRMADAQARCFDVGVLAAVNRVTGRAADAVGAYNLVLDDRPRNLDYFNAARVTRWLTQIERACAGTHVDFAWTPDHSRPSIRYINALKEFNTGFVWHGLLRHVDHRLLRQPSVDHERGLRLIADICRRYTVRFQPIMILPFQEVDARMLAFLRDAGFGAAVFHGEPRPGIRPRLPAFMRYSTFQHEAYCDTLPTLRRYLAAELTRARLLAEAALDLPIIAAAHPFEVGLRRFAGIYKPWEPVSLHFDEVLAFAREKGLRPLSLEQIAGEVIAAPVPAADAPARPDAMTEAAGIAL